jgi:pimeloyl-ACP methyl ester carboxylesterase
MRGELVFFEATDRVRLCGFLTRPRRRSDRIVIYLHGLKGNFSKSASVRSLSKTLNREGFNFLSIEQRGSYLVNHFWKGAKGKSLLAGGAFEKFEDCRHDIEGSVRLARRMGMKRIYLAGHSTGCQKAAYYLSKHPNRMVKGLMLSAPADDYNSDMKEMGRNFGAAVAFARRQSKKDRNALMPERYGAGFTSVSRFLSYCDLRNVESRIFNYNLDKLDVFRRVKVPVLALFGTREQYALKPVKEYMKILAGNYRGVSFRGVLIKGANHGFRGKEDALANETVHWLDDTESKYARK